MTPQNFCAGTSLVVQWLKLHASTAGGTGLIPPRRTKIPHAKSVPLPLLPCEDTMRNLRPRSTSPKHANILILNFQPLEINTLFKKKKSVYRLPSPWYWVRTSQTDWNIQTETCITLSLLFLHSYHSHIHSSVTPLLLIKQFIFINESEKFLNKHIHIHQARNV